MNDDNGEKWMTIGIVIMVSMIIMQCVAGDPKNYHADCKKWKGEPRKVRACMGGKG